MVGCVLALFAAENRRYLEKIAAWHPTLMRTAAVLLMYVPIVLGQQLLLGKLTVTLGALIQAICAGFLIVSLVYHRQGAAFRFLNLPGIAFIGAISYSLYVWQMPFLAKAEVYGGHEEWFLKFPYDLVMVIVAALASYYLLEKPFAKLRRKFHSRSDGRESSLQHRLRP
jgi:peptidoglycan/LPS O-acetylase OafA/YrhL